MKIRVYPYKMGSESAKTLARGLGGIRVYPNRNYIPRQDHLIINWGNSTWPNWNYSRATFLNPPFAVAESVNKAFTFQHFVTRDVKHPDWSRDKELAIGWIQDGHKVFCRTTLTGHSGEGIIIASTEDGLVDAPLYVKAVKKDKEYRVHVFNGQVIDFVQKKKRHGFEGGTPGIRNHANGWVFAREGVTLPEEVKTEATKAIAALGLDFGAVDVCTDHNGDVFVFEVNSAPGLEGTTLQKYIEAFSTYGRT